MPRNTPIKPIKFSALLTKAINTTVAKRISAINDAKNHFEQAFFKAKAKLDETFSEMLSKQFGLLSEDYVSGTEEKKQFALKHLVKIYENTYNIAYSNDSDEVNKAINELYSISKILIDAGYGSIDTPSEEDSEESESGGRTFTLCEGSVDTPSSDVDLKNIHIKKPKQNELDADEHISFSPDFANYLRRIDKSFLLTLTAFENWYKKEHPEVEHAEGDQAEQENLEEVVSDYTELYRSELQDALEDYEDKTFKRIYCKPTNIPMPGMQTGHRLLKLPIRIDPENDYNKYRYVAENNIIGKIYQGPLGTVESPDVDYEELIRRYVNALYLKPITVYNFDDITENDINVYFDTKTDILDLDKLVIFKEAIKLAVGSEKLQDYILENLEQGNDITTEKLNEWILNESIEESSELRNQIIEIWQSSLNEIIPGISQGLIEDSPTSSEFIKLFIGLCLPSVPHQQNSPHGIPGPQNAGAAYYDITPELKANIPWLDVPEKWQIDEFGPITIEEKNPGEEEIRGKSFVDAVVRRVDALVECYDKPWRAVCEIVGADSILKDYDDKILYSGYELKNIILVLVQRTLELIYGKTYNGTKYDGNHEVDGSTNQDAARYLNGNYINNLHLLLGPEEIKNLIFHEQDVALPLQLNDLYQNQFENSELSNQLDTFIKTIETSYNNIIDVLLSISPASRITSTTVELDDERIDNLYTHWVTTFIDFIKQYSAKRTIAKQKRYYLRLVPRMGKYGEIPNPENISTINLNQLLPSHPRIQTENYMLEPMPQKYACNPFPTLYLRQDLSLTINHLGFGIGSNLYSMSLLPEEEQVITVKSFKDTKLSSSESTAENIFEEAGSETSKDFAREMQHESERESKSQSEFSISGKASASFGFGSASVESGYSSKSDSRALAKSASACTNRLASKLSAKRNVSIDTQRTVNKEVDIHSELATERKVKNPNKGHTLTFHWFQMTRKLSTELRLNDLKLVYTSGVHNRVAVFGNGAKPEDIEESSFYVLPPDVGNKLPPNSVIAIHTEPYTESISMANANVFLARVFKKAKALETSSLLWKILGTGDAAPEGYGIAAFCGPSQNIGKDQKYISVLNNIQLVEYLKWDSEYVPADELTIQNGNGGNTVYFPNIDLRYKREDGLTPTRYSADEFNGYSMPLVLLREQQVINTNGVYCDAMIGRCTALEDYLQRHRDLDLLEKKLEVGNKELDFKWALEKDGLDVIMAENDETITGIVKEKSDGEGFKSRKDLEALQNAEEQSIATDMIKKSQLEKELALLDAKIAQAGIAPNYKLDVPEGTNLSINADIETTNSDMDSESEDES